MSDAKRIVGVVLAVLLHARGAAADEPPPRAVEDPPAHPVDARAEPDPHRPEPRRPAPYSLPWQLRSVGVSNSVRSDTSFARYENTSATTGLTIATMLTGSAVVVHGRAPGDGLAALVRLAMVNDSPPSGNGGLAIVNPLVGATYAFRLAEPLRVAFSLGVTIPVGAGGGASPGPGVLDARTKGPLARAAMDNSLFAVNDLTVIPGVDVAFVMSGVTLQAEATLFQLQRVRGEAQQPEASKTNFTSGFHAGVFVVPWLSLGAELRYQRWINAPFAVENDPTNTLVDNLTIAGGPRFHIHAGSVWLRPGIAYARGLDKPMAAAAPNYHIVQIDVPVVF